MLIDLTFFYENMFTILAMVIIFLLLLGIFAYLGLNFNQSQPSKIEKIVVIESFNEKNYN